MAQGEEQANDRAPEDITEATMAEKLTVFNPTGYPPKVVGKRLAPRSQSLEGKTLSLADRRHPHDQAARKLG
jgi:hypothetical protein